MDIKRLTFFLIIAWLPALIGGDTVGSTANLFQDGAANPCFVPGHFFQLYIWSPLIVLSSFVLFVSPGLILALASGAVKTVGKWLIYGYAASLFATSFAAGLVQWIIGTPLRGNYFAGTIIFCTFLAILLLWHREKQGHITSFPFSDTYGRSTLLLVGTVLYLLLVTLTPKFYWENFNGDGAHAFESARLLLVQPFPFWHTDAGDISSFPGVTSFLFAYPSSWFIRLFGEYEAAARFPFLLALTALFGGILELVEYSRLKRTIFSERALIWLALVIFTVTMGYSATYNPYSADFAMPAAQDTQLIALFLGFGLAFLSGEKMWLTLLAVLTYFALPSGLLLMVLWIAGFYLLTKNVPYIQVVRTVLSLIIAAVIAGILMRLAAKFWFPVNGNEYGLLNTLKRLAFLQFDDWRRLIYVIVPTGILPFFALFAWRQKDDVSRVLTFVTVAYFLFFYVQAYISLHHFFPVMILPLVIFWRRVSFLDKPRQRTLVLSSVFILGLISLWLSLPSSWAIDRSGRQVGAKIEDRIGGYKLNEFNPKEFRRAELLGSIFPLDWSPQVPNESYGGSPLVWNHYSHLVENKYNGEKIPANYILQKKTSPAPSPDAILAAADDDAALYVLNRDVWANDLSLRPPTPAGSDLYYVPRGVLFRSIPLNEKRPHIISVPETLKRWGLDVYPLLDSLGIKH